MVAEILIRATLRCRAAMMMARPAPGIYADWVTQLPCAHRSVYSQCLANILVVHRLVVYSDRPRWNQAVLRAAGTHHISRRYVRDNGTLLRNLARSAKETPTMPRRVLTTIALRRPSPRC
jgi:hypothetical protein